MEQQATPEATSLKLHYFYIRGTAQPIRHLLYHLKIEFQDVVHEIGPQNQMEVSFGIGYPMLEDGDIKVRETIAIMNYICRKYNHEELIGLTPQKNARIQQILMKFTVQRKRIMMLICQMFSRLPEAEDKIGEVDAWARKLSKECSFMEYCLRHLHKPQNTILEDLTIIDFIFYEQCFYINGFFGAYIGKESEFSSYIIFKNNFEGMQFFKKNQMKIKEKYLFHAFSNQEINDIIQSYWKGQAIPLLKYQENTTTTI